MITNGHSPQAVELPGPGLWIIVVDGGCGYFGRTTREMTEQEVAQAMELTGHVKLSLQPMFVLDSVRGAMADANRNLVPMTIPITQRIDQRMGLREEFPVHITAHAVVFLSTFSPVTTAALASILDEYEAALREHRAKSAGIVLSPVR